MKWNDIEETVEEARRTLRNADWLAEKIANHLVGRLKHVNGRVLKQLKRELKDFNAKTEEWKI